MSLADDAKTDRQREAIQALRDVPAQSGFPNTIDWPEV